MNHLSLIIKREYLTKVRNRSFIIMTFLSPLIMVGIISLVAFLSQLNNDTVRTISVLDESGLFLDQFEDENNLKFQMITNMSLEAAKKSAEEDEIYGLLFIPKV
ncbi:MAG: ABC transporter permease, partial [Bacteroidetes bacterium]